MGGYSDGSYDLLAKCLGIPCERSLQNHEISTTNEPDGPLLANIEKGKKYFDNRNPYANEMSWQRMSSLKWDSMAIKSGLVVNMRTEEIVGVAHDEGDMTKLISAELKELKACEMSEEELSAAINKVNADPQLPTLSKHMLAFVISSWSPKDINGHAFKCEFVVARYGLRSVDSQFLVPTVLS